MRLSRNTTTTYAQSNTQVVRRITYRMRHHRITDSVELGICVDNGCQQQFFFANYANNFAGFLPDIGVITRTEEI